MKECKKKKKFTVYKVHNWNEVNCVPSVEKFRFLAHMLECSVRPLTAYTLKLLAFV
jgi:hypothetical protein